MGSPEQQGRGRVTLVIIPAHGASLFQWRLRSWTLALLLLGLGGLIGAAAWVVGRDARQRRDLAQAAEIKESNLRLARDLSRGRDALLRVAQLEAQLRHMLKFRDEKSLLRSQAVGGPSEEDMRRLGQLLDEAPQQAEGEAQRSLSELMQAAREREKRVDEILSYVRRRSTLWASRPSLWPVRGWISSGFGERTNPVTAKDNFHTGVDIANDTGTPVHCTAEGTVAFAGWEGGYGKLVVVDHGNGYSTYYGHLSELKTAVGKKVRRGEQLGRVGATGNTTGPHLHYEIRLYGAAIDPSKYLEE